MAARAEEDTERLLFALFLSACVLFSAFRGYLARSEAAPGEAALTFETRPVDPNRAGPAELALLPGIGPRLAEAVVRYREAHGPFRCARDLEKVKGLGAVKVKTLLPWTVWGAGAGGTGSLPRPEEPPLEER